MERDSEKRNYMTRGYFLVRDVLIKAGGAHMSADEVHARLTEAGERVGRTTVYRQLERLVASGAARKMNGDRTGHCYAYADEHCAEHYHMICTECGKLAHLSCDHVEELFHHIKSEHGFVIDPSQTVLYGKCAVCIRSAKKKEETI